MAPRRPVYSEVGCLSCEATGKRRLQKLGVPREIADTAAGVLEPPRVYSMNTLFE